MQEYAYINGQIMPIADAKIHITDLSILRGYGVFDFFRAIDGQPIFMEEHLDRFDYSTSKLGLDLPYSREHIRENILDLIKLNQHNLLGIKLLCTGGYSEDGYTPTRPNVMMLAKPFKMPQQNDSIKLMLVEHLRELPDIKTINYIVPIANLPKMRAVGAHDVLYHYNGLISESSRSNIFMVKEEKVITPSRNILQGITRKNILKILKNNFEVEERDITLDEFLKADEAFISGSTKRVVPVQFVDNQEFTQRKITKKILELLIQNEK